MYPSYTLNPVSTPFPVAPLGARPPLGRAATAYERVREMILSGQLAPGSVVTEAELVRKLEMSRTPVREALHRLETAGYLRSARDVGYVVIELSERDMINVYMVRAVLEGLAAEHAAQLGTRTDLGRLEDLYEAMAAAREHGDDAELTRLNSLFHRAIAEASGNTYVLAMLDNIRDVFERFRATAVTELRRREESHAEHGELIAALRARDKERARSLAVEHVHRALEFRRRHAEQHRDEER